MHISGVGMLSVGSILGEDIKVLWRCLLKYRQSFSHILAISLVFYTLLA